MKLLTKKNITMGAFLLVVASRLGGYCGVFPEACPLSSYFDGIVFSVLEPLFYLSLGLFFSGLTTLFVRDEVFAFWLKFAQWWVPLTVLLIVISPTDGGGGFFPALISKELTSMWMSGLFVLASLILIIYKSLHVRSEKVNT